MRQISNPKRSIISIPGVRKRVREERYLPEIERSLGLHIGSFKLSELPYGSDAHAINYTSSEGGPTPKNSTKNSSLLATEDGNSNSSAPASSSRGSATPLWPLRTVTVRYHCEAADRAWLTQYNSCVNPKKEAGGSGSKGGGKGGSLSVDSVVRGLVGGPSSAGTSPPLKPISQAASGPNTISEACLEDAFTLLELHYRYLGYGPAASNMSIQSILAVKDASPSTDKTAARKSSKGAAAQPIYGVPTHRLASASEMARQSLKTYWVIKRTAAGLYNDGLVAEEQQPAMSGKAVGSKSSSSAAASQLASKGSSTFSAADAIPPFRRSLIPELCRDEQLSGPHPQIASMMVAAGVASSNRSSVGGISASSNGLIFSTDVLTSAAGDVFGDYSVPFTHRAWECPVVVQQTQRPETSASATSEVHTRLEKFATISAQLVEELRVREALASQALQLHCHQLALLRKEAEDHLSHSLHAVGSIAASNNYVPLAAELQTIRGLLLPAPTAIAFSLAEDEEY